jgi:hypothetical protein
MSIILPDGAILGEDPKAPDHCRKAIKRLLRFIVVSAEPTEGTWGRMLGLVAAVDMGRAEDEAENAERAA